MTTIIIYPDNSVCINGLVSAEPDLDVLKEYNIPEERRGSPDSVEIFIRGDNEIRAFSNAALDKKVQQKEYRERYKQFSRSNFEHTINRIQGEIKRRGISRLLERVKE